MADCDFALALIEIPMATARSIVPDDFEVKPYNLVDTGTASAWWTAASCDEGPDGLSARYSFVSVAVLPRIAALEDPRLSGFEFVVEAIVPPSGLASLLASWKVALTNASGFAVGLEPAVPLPGAAFEAALDGASHGFSMSRNEATQGVLFSDLALRSYFAVDGGYAYVESTWGNDASASSSPPTTCEFHTAPGPARPLLGESGRCNGESFRAILLKEAAAGFIPLQA